MKTSVRLSFELGKGTKIKVKADPKHPYTVLYDKGGPAGKRVLGVLKGRSGTITLPRAVDAGELVVIGSADETKWNATKKTLERGARVRPRVGPPGTAGNNTGKRASARLAPPGTAGNNTGKRVRARLAPPGTAGNNTGMV